MVFIPLTFARSRGGAMKPETEVSTVLDGPDKCLCNKKTYV